MARATDQARAIAVHVARRVSGTWRTGTAAIYARFSAVLDLVRAAGIDADVVEAAATSAVRSLQARLPIRTRIAGATAIDRRFVAVVDAVCTRRRLTGSRANARTTVVGTLASLSYLAMGRTDTTTIDRRFVSVLDRVLTASDLTDLLSANFARAIADVEATLPSVARRTKASTVDSGLILTGLPVVAKACRSRSAAQRVQRTGVTAEVASRSRSRGAEVIGELGVRGCEKRTGHHTGQDCCEHQAEPPMSAGHLFDPAWADVRRLRSPGDVYPHGTTHRSAVSEQIRIKTAARPRGSRRRHGIRRRIRRNTSRA